ncbi:hypothetical protein RND81_02G059200 [Saponaria officinalis]|uniref:NAC domain-containing protein n=1 Tax=Saponaria officinalis TaxID=3572 RepID=A0AAW1MKV8_SAPOF
MWTIEDVLSELRERGEEEDNEKGKNNNNGLPPGFRFHPTDEELITYYLASKVFYNHNINTPVHIAEVDLNRCEPWDLPERAKMGEKEWYLYSLRDRKYPTGLRTNRATGSGYWKATGKDRQVNAGGSVTGTAGDGSSTSGGMLIGMKKTLVFYQGRAPRGVKTRWVMHEYRLDGHFSSFRFSSKEEWVICRIFHKHGGDKKTTLFHPPPPPRLPPPLSPFLRCLPPLLDVPTTSSSSSSSTLQTLQISNHKPHNINNNNSNSNFLLQSLLSNPLPNFSSLTSDPTTASSTTAATSVGHLFNPLCQTGIINASKQKRNNDCCANKNCSSSNNIPFSFCDTDDWHNDDDDDDEGDVNVGFDMSNSVNALDRLLYHPHHINFSTHEAWPFHH